MENSLTLASDSRSVSEFSLAEEAQRAQGYADHAKASKTLLAYESDWKDFIAYCRPRSLSSLPAAPETVALYLAWLAGQGRKAATLARRLSAITERHRAEKLDSPSALRHFCVKQVWDGIKRTDGIAQTRKQPAITGDLKRLLAELPSTLTGTRDRAMLLVGFAGALRRSELVALNAEDIRFVPQGIELAIRRSKTDQEGAGENIGIQIGRDPATCPLLALNLWLDDSGITSGPLFRPITRYQTVRNRRLTDQVVAHMVKRYAKVAGLTGDYSGHSLRAGLATSAAIAGAAERHIMKQTRHKSVSTVRKYIRDGEIFRDNVSGCVGL